MEAVHASAERGFGQQAEAYARGRPDYPEALSGWLDAELGVRAGSEVADLGAGTGKFTRLLLRTGAEAVAIEPVAAMRAKLLESLPDVRVLEGTAQSIPLPDHALDAVLCAQAFHWFASETALREIHRVLRPGAPLGLVWNVRDERVDWVAELTRIVAPYEGSTPRFHSGQWRRAFAGAPFSALTLREFAYEHIGAPEQVIIDRTLSISFIAALPNEQKARVEQRLRELVETHPALAGRTEVAFPYRTEAYCARAE